MNLDTITTEPVDPQLDLAASRLLYPITDMGMPDPGPNFLRHATELAGLSDETIDKAQVIPVLESLYRMALYDENFFLPIVYKGKTTLTQFVPGRCPGTTEAGPKRAKVLVLDKWPSLQDLQQGFGNGFVGEKLREVLAELGVDPDISRSWYYTGVINFVNFDVTKKTIGVEWLNDCRMLLEQEIRLVRPDIILCLGSDAAKAVLGKKAGKLVNLVDQTHHLTFFEGFDENGDDVYTNIKVIVTVNPGAVVHNPATVDDLKANLQYFCDVWREDESVALPELDWQEVYTEDLLIQVVDEILASSSTMIAIDCEWYGQWPGEPDNWLRTIQISWAPLKAAVIVLRDQNNRSVFSPGHDAVKRQLRRLFVESNDRFRIAGHNFRADLVWLLHFDGLLGTTMLRLFEAPATPEETKTKGGFDTMLGVHSIQEEAGAFGYKLEVCAAKYCQIPRYDSKVAQLHKEMDKLGRDNRSFDDLHVYGAWDAAVTWLLAEKLNTELLDKDRYGNNCRVPFWISMTASAPCFEVERVGLRIDRAKGDQLTAIYTEAVTDIQEELRDLIQWPDFNPSSVVQCRILLFGLEHSRAAALLKNETVDPNDFYPPTARLLGFMPISTSSKPKKNWHEVVQKGEEHLYSPATDKETLGILIASIDDSTEEGATKKKVVSLLRSVRFLQHVLRNSLGKANVDEAGNVIQDEDDNIVYSRGLLTLIRRDGRVRTSLFQTLETGRYSSSRPNLQNMSKRREEDYQKILGERYAFPTRALIAASPGYALVETDFSGAELRQTAIQSGDVLMTDHTSKTELPDDHPDKVDIHSRIAVAAFKLDCEPTKQGLATVGKKALRDVAKTLIFGLLYGRSVTAVVRAIQETGVSVTDQEAEKIVETVFTQYPALPLFFDECKRRVHEPGWMRNCFGRYRRFHPTNDNAKRAGQEREAMNFLIQSGIADALSLVFAKLHHHPERFDRHGRWRYRLCLPIHDAILAEVRIQDLEWFAGTKGHHGFMAEVMTSVPLVRCDFNGRRMDANDHALFADTDVYLNWGVKYSRAEGILAGLPEKFLPKK